MMEIKKEYYGVKDIKIIIGCGESMAYQIIRELRERFSRTYSDAITIRAKIPIWYFEEQMHYKKPEKE